MERYGIGHVGGALAAAFGIAISAHGELREVFPHVRVDVEAKIVEFDGHVPIVVNDPEAPDVYLEVIACTPDTKEHESLVVTEARPSHIHAALLMIGLQPGKPGSWTWDGAGAEAKLNAHDPSGDAVRIELLWTDPAGAARSARPADWMMNKESGQALADLPFIFAGSQMLDRGLGLGELYDADGAGTLIGLATFGAETIAWPTTFSPDADVAEPVWIANPKTTPSVDTPVRVRLTPAQ